MQVIKLAAFYFFVIIASNILWGYALMKIIFVLGTCYSVQKINNMKKNPWPGQRAVSGDMLNKKSKQGIAKAIFMLFFGWLIKKEI